MGPSGLRNDVAQEAAFSITGDPGNRQLQGTLRNDGWISHFGSSVTIQDSGVLENREGATLKVFNNAFYGTSGVGNRRIESDGTLLKSGTGVATIQSRLINRSSLQVEGGELRLRHIGELTGLGTVFAGPGDGIPKLVICGVSTSAITLQSTRFEFANGLVEVSHGTHPLTGTIAGSGQGLFEQIAGTLRVETGLSATLNFPATAPFSFNGFSAVRSSSRAEE